MENSNVDFLKVFKCIKNCEHFYFNWKAQNSLFIPNISPNSYFRMVVSVTYCGGSLAAPMLSFF